MKRGLAALVFALAAWLSASPARAATPAEVYAAAVQALERGAPEEAAARLELLADQGFVHPDASLARAAAYLARAESSRAKPGDLGRAVAALHEALALRPGDEAIERALASVDSELARRRARTSGNALVATPRLSRALAALLPENAWALGAALGSLALTAGLLTRRATVKPHPRLAGAVAIGVGATVLFVMGAGAYESQRNRRSSAPAVVIVPEARLLDDAGRALTAGRGEADPRLPEGALVYVLERADGRSRVEWGSRTGWVSSTDVLILATGARAALGAP